MASFRKRLGKWQVQVRIRGKAAISKTFPTKEIARAWAIEQERQILSNGYLAKETRGIALRELFDRYRTTVTPKKKSALSESYRLIALSSSSLGRISTASIKPQDIAHYRDERLTMVSSSTVRREMVLLRSVFNVAAHEWGYVLLKGLFQSISLPKESHHRIRRISEDELTQMWDALASQSNPIYLIIAQLALETGMRRSELLNLNIKNINDTVIEVVTSKSGHPRLVPLTNKAKEILSNITLTQDSLLFNVHPNALRLAWERARAKSGVNDLRFHDLRHEAISRMLESGLSVAEVATVSGHRDYKSLFKYAHLDVQKITRKLNVFRNQEDALHNQNHALIGR